jgi:hypothetical protein|tara:strand:+ start:254 stop:433 length:180 start_codon:yes stop_codon:yes gene_type:complete
MIVAVTDIIKFFEDLDRLKNLAKSEDPDINRIVKLIQHMECPEIIEYEKFDIKEETARA